MRTRILEDLPTHGRTGYKRGCGCDICRQAANEAASRRSRALAYGHVFTTDAAPVRAHVALLHDSGLTYSQIARLAGVSRGCIVGVAGVEGRAPTKRMHVATAERILAARPKIARLNPTDTVDATGSTRMLQALGTLGWHARLLSEETGLPSKTIEKVRLGRQPKVRRSTADAIRAVYPRLSLTTPPPSERTSQMRTLARSRSWAPPAAWDDDAIGVPNAVPHTAQPEVRTPRPVALAEDVAFIRRTTGLEDLGLIAERLQVTRNTLDRNLDRAKQLAAA